MNTCPRCKGHAVVHLLLGIPDFLLGSPEPS